MQFMKQLFLNYMNKINYIKNIIKKWYKLLNINIFNNYRI